MHAIVNLSSQSDQDKKELVIVPIYRLKSNLEDKMTFAFAEYFGLENKKTYKYSMINKEKIFV